MSVKVGGYYDGGPQLKRTGTR